PRAVDGSADGVGDADAALGGDAGGVAGVEPLDATGGVLEAVAGGAPVSGGSGSGLEAPHAVAAGRGRAGAAAAGVGEAGANG
ncbi:Os11g0428150, partial [Oryza sativa Japonica Group]